MNCYCLNSINLMTMNYWMNYCLTKKTSYSDWNYFVKTRTNYCLTDCWTIPN